MEIVESLYEYFGIELLTESATLIDVLNGIIQIGLSVWFTMFIIRCLFLSTTFPERRFF